MSERTSQLQGFYRQIEEALTYTKSHNLYSKKLIIVLGNDFKDLRIDGEIVYFLLSENDISTENPLLFSAQINDFVVEKISMLVTLLRLNSVNISGDQRFLDKYKTLIEHAGIEIKKALSNLNTEKHSRFIRLRNTLKNMPLIQKNACHELHREKRRRPVVICAAGPALEEDATILKEYQDRVLIICVGHALKTLSIHGICPDYVVEIDPECFMNWRNLKSSESLLVVSADVSPEVPQLFPKVKFFQGDFEDVNDLLGASGCLLPRLDLSNNVTVAALSLALKLGFRSIAVCGLNLSYSQCGVEHSHGVKHVVNDQMQAVKGYGGKTLYAPENLLRVHHAINDYIGSVKKKYPGLEVYNCSSEGAVVDETIRCDLHNYMKSFSGKAFKPKEFELKREGCLYSELPLKAVQEYAKVTEKISSIASDLLKAHNRQASETCMEQIQRDVQVHLSECKKLSETGALKALVNCLTIQIDDYVAEYIGSSTDDVTRHIEKFSFKWRLHTDFTSEVARDLAGLSKDTYSFGSFQEMFKEFIGKNNRHLASHFLDAERKSDWQVVLIDQQLPFISWQKGDGELAPLSSKLSMKQEAGAIVTKFVEENNFCPERDAVVFMSPGNWSIVCEFNRRFQTNHSVVIENDCDVMQLISRHAMIAHQLSPNCTVILWSDELRRQKSIWRCKQDEWKGRRVLFLECPFSQGLPRAKELCDTLKVS